MATVSTVQSPLCQMSFKRNCEKPVSAPTVPLTFGSASSGRLKSSDIESSLVSPMNCSV